MGNRNNYPDRTTVDRLKWLYQAGSRVQLDEMDDPQAPPVGTFGTVYGVDDTGSIMVQWDNGTMAVACPWCMAWTAATWYAAPP